ncbi:MAGE family-domain-containing protein, partial [Pseudomassariella vexata]
RRRQSRRDADSEDSEDSEQDEDGDVNMNGGAANEEAQLVKKLVRYALACEYSRTSIKRDGIRDKVLGNNARSFKRVFDGAQKQLQDVFGMEMVELPVKEKRTLKEKQQATARKAKSQGATSSRQYILTSILPSAYKTNSIIAPSRTPSASEEAGYVGFYTFVISIIALSGGELSDVKLRRHLTRMNAKDNLPFGKTDDILTRMVKQAYVDKVVEKNDAGEEPTVSWCVGSRGRVEVPPQSIAGFAQEVFGEQVDEDFQKRLYKSLGLQE